MLAESLAGRIAPSPVAQCLLIPEGSPMQRGKAHFRVCQFCTARTCLRARRSCGEGPLECSGGQERWPRLPPRVRAGLLGAGGGVAGLRGSLKPRRPRGCGWSGRHRVQQPYHNGVQQPYHNGCVRLLVPFGAIPACVGLARRFQIPRCPYFKSVYMEQLSQIQRNIGQRRLFTYPKPIFDLYSTGYKFEPTGS